MTNSTEKAFPIAPTERFISLDVLRGIAVFGILVMNVQSFSMIGSAYTNPTAYGDLTGANKLVWILSHVFADQKFMTIFSILFGAGIAMMAERMVARGGMAAGLHYRRTFWLLVIGALHAYLLWYGDYSIHPERNSLSDHGNGWGAMDSHLLGKPHKNSHPE